MSHFWKKFCDSARSFFSDLFYLFLYLRISTEDLQAQNSRNLAKRKESTIFHEQLAGF